MNTLPEQISNIVSAVAKELWGDFAAPVIIEKSSRPELGEYATNLAMILSKKLNKPPLEIAQELSASIKDSMFEAVDAVAPGFVNFRLSNEFLLSQLSIATNKGEEWGKGEKNNETQIVEYGQMNIAKEMHIGHLSSMVIGDSILKILEFNGYPVISDMHQGDWGTQFGILLYAYKNHGSREVVEKDPIPELLKLYVDMNARIEEDPELRELGKAEFKKLEDGDSENRELWQWFVDLSMDKFQWAWDKLQIRPYDYKLGESYYELVMTDILNDLVAKGIAIQEDKLIYVDLEPYKLGRCILQKTDGATMYALRDIATYLHRQKEFKFSKNLYVVDHRQAHHFRQFLKVLDLMGHSASEDSYHVIHGEVRLKGGSMSTRKGTVISLDMLIEEGIKKADEMLTQKESEVDDKAKAAEVIAVGAIKLGNLIPNRESDITFDWDTAFDWSGTSGPYLQYTYARLRSILRKLEVTDFNLSNDLQVSEVDRPLLVQIHCWPMVIEDAAKSYAPHLIATYLFELTSAMNTFYQNTSVKDSKGEERDLRVAMVGATSQVLKQGLALLGVDVLEKM